MLNTIGGKIPVKIALDTCIAPQPNRSYIAQKSALDIQLLTNTADSYSSSNVSVNINPPRGTMTDKMIMSRCAGIWSMNYTPQAPGIPLFPAVTGVAPNQYLGGTDAVNFMPFQSSASSAQITINGTSISQELNQFLPAVNRYGLLAQERELYDSTYPSYQDQYFTFADGFGTNRNSLGAYGDNVAVTPRGGFGYTVLLDDPVQGVARVRVDWYEPIVLSPLSTTITGEVGFYDVQTIQLQFGLSGIEKAWSHDIVNNPAVINSITFEWASAPAFQTRHCTPITPVTIDYNQLHEAVSIQRQTSQISPFMAGETRVVTLNNIRLNSMPSKLYIFFQQRQSTKQITDAEFYAYISNLSINIGNKASQLASYSPEMLYKMNVQNGYTLSWVQHKYHVGSVMCVNLGKDLPMEVAEATGVREDINLQVSATITNQTDFIVEYDGQLVILYDGILSVGRDGGSSLVIGPLNMADVLSAGIESSKASENIISAERDSFYAGKIDWKSTGQKIKSVAKKYGPAALKAAEKYAPDLIRTGTSFVSPRLGAIADEALKLVGKGYTAGQAKKYIKQKYPQLRAKEINDALHSVFPQRGGRYIGDDEMGNLVSDFSHRF